MGVPAVGNIWQLAVGYLVHGQQCYNTFGFRVQQLGDATDDGQISLGLGDAAINTWATGYVTDAKAMMSTEAVFNRVDVRKIQPNDFPLQTFTYNVPGTDIDPCDIQNVALSIQRYGEGPPYRRKGRIAMGGLPKQEGQAGRWRPATLTLALNIVPHITGTFTTPNTDTVMEVGFWAPQRVKPNGDILPAHWQHCTYATVHSTVRTQRSRTVDVGI